LGLRRGSALAIVLNLLPVYASGKPEKTFEGAEEAARRAIELDPETPQLVVEALADPGGRHRALTATDDLPPDEFVVHASVILRDTDRAARVVRDLERGTDVMDNVIWWDVARPTGQTTGFRQLVGALGREQLWRARGWPDKCRPKGSRNFVCDRYGLIAMRALSRTAKGRGKALRLPQFCDST
jgi:hypothetical protein